MRRLAPIILAATAALSLYGQTAISFEVASIRPNLNGGADSIRTKDGDGRFTAINQSATMLILTAFDIRRFQLVGGPRWLDSDKFDIVAKTGGTGSITQEQIGPLLQSLLADRFQLNVHREIRNLTGYSLVIGKGGPKLNANNGAEGTEGLETRRNNGKAVTIATKKPLDEFVKFLGSQLGGVVTDNTGLKGRFDFRMDWSYDPDLESSAPTIFTALPEQLGLRLVSRKGPVEVIVIDSIEKPSGN
jgi:uncharacterized protein (TIGR03435 family)